MIPVNRFEYVPDSHNAKDWQKAIEDLLAVIDKICRDYDINYCLSFGGLLGAIRHRGMIPWDNDADIVMFEDDYLKFRELCASGAIPDDYKLIDRATEDGYSLVFGRFIDTRTACPLSTSSFNGGSNGVFIDVFILFPIPEEQSTQIDCITDFLVWEEMLCHVKRRCKNRSELFAKRWEMAKQVEADKGREETLRILEERFRSKMPSSSAKCIHGSGGAYNGFPVLDTAWFENPVRMPFGSHEFLVPNGYFSFFRRFYGNSWRMFPEGVRFSAYSCANLNMPGNQIVDDYMQFIDQDDAISIIDENKQLKMQEMLVKRKLEPLKWSMRAQLFADEFKKSNRQFIPEYRKALSPQALASTDLDLEEMGKIQNRTYDVIRYQLAPSMKSWNVAIPFDSVLLSMALWSYYLVKPDFWTVEKVISRQRADEPHCVYGGNSIDMLLDEALTATGGLYEAIDLDDADMAKRCTAQLVSICPSVRHAQVGLTFGLLSESRQDASRLQAARAAAEEGLSSYEDDDYLRLFAAEAAALQDDNARAQELFDLISAESMNGMVLQWSQDFCRKYRLSFKMRNLSSIPVSTVDQSLPKVRFPKFKSFKARMLYRKTNFKFGISELETELRRIAEQLAPYSEKIDRYHALRRLSSDRFYVWERTYPRKQALVQASKEGKLDEVRQYARPFIEGVYRLYDNDQVGLFVDEEILQACLPIFEEDRGRAFVEEYLSLIPPAHHENIDDMLRRRGIDHPYLHKDSFVKE